VTLMTPFLSYLSGLGAWNWFIAAALLMLLETIVPGVHFLWFGLAAAIVGILVMGIDYAAAGHMFVWQFQLIAFALISVATVFWVRSKATIDTARSDLPDLNVRGAQYIGRTFEVVEAIRDGRGKIKVGDTMWLASGADVPAGTQVRVTGVDGTALVVTPVSG
jgi:membrane protein implicated in regulation of membrane protease activity